MKKIDLSGERYGRLLVVSEHPERKNGKVRWNCFCDCGNSTIAKGNNLKSGSVSSCGCLYKECHQNLKIDLLNQRFGMLLIVEEVPTDKKGIYYKCKCDCGKEIIRNSRSFKRYNIQSCGCVRKNGGDKIRGENNPNWNPNLTEEDRLNRARPPEETSRWTRAVIKRDGFKCKICNGKKRIVAHHLDGWNWCEERRFDIDNGVTLCDFHHKEFHKIYGYGDNTSEEFFEYYMVNK
jgi:hypothetical protein